jgi:hypothetical protein
MLFLYLKEEMMNMPFNDSKPDLLHILWIYRGADTAFAQALWAAGVLS